MDELSRRPAGGAVISSASDGGARTPPLFKEAGYEELKPAKAWCDGVALFGCKEPSFSRNRFMCSNCRPKLAEISNACMLVAVGSGRLFRYLHQNRFYPSVSHPLAALRMCVHAEDQVARAALLVFPDPSRREAWRRHTDDPELLSVLSSVQLFELPPEPALRITYVTSSHHYALDEQLVKLVLTRALARSPPVARPGPLPPAERAASSAPADVAAELLRLARLNLRYHPRDLSTHTPETLRSLDSVRALLQQLLGGPLAPPGFTRGDVGGRLFDALESHVGSMADRSALGKLLRLAAKYFNNHDPAKDPAVASVLLELESLMVQHDREESLRSRLELSYSLRTADKENPAALAEAAAVLEGVLKEAQVSHQAAWSTDLRRKARSNLVRTLTLLRPAAGSEQRERLRELVRDSLGQDIRELRASVAEASPVKKMDAERDLSKQLLTLARAERFVGDGPDQVLARLEEAHEAVHGHESSEDLVEALLERADYSWSWGARRMRAPACSRRQAAAASSSFTCRTRACARPTGCACA